MPLIYWGVLGVMGIWGSAKLADELNGENPVFPENPPEMTAEDQLKSVLILAGITAAVIYADKKGLI